MALQVLSVQGMPMQAMPLQKQWLLKQCITIADTGLEISSSFYCYGDREAIVL
jgi:hypothetical protein